MLKESVVPALYGRKTLKYQERKLAEAFHGNNWDKRRLRQFGWVSRTLSRRSIGDSACRWRYFRSFCCEKPGSTEIFQKDRPSDGRLRGPWEDKGEANEPPALQIDHFGPQYAWLEWSGVGQRNQEGGKSLQSGVNDHLLLFCGRGDSQ